MPSQTGDFARDLGRQVMETLLQAHPDVNIVYAHNDEMAIGAIQALELAGRKPGDDVLVVSIDGTRDALQAIIDGKMGVTVESSPFFGPLARETMKRYTNGETHRTLGQGRRPHLHQGERRDAYRQRLLIFTALGREAGPLLRFRFFHAKLSYNRILCTALD